MTAVKWAIFVVAVLASFPAGRWLRDRPALRIQLWTLVGLLPFVGPGYMALVFFGGRPGDTYGIEVALLDWLALSLLLAAKPADRPPPYRFALSLYLLVVVVSIMQARWPLHAAGYAWKLGRMYLLYAAIWRSGGEDERVPAALLRGLTSGVAYEGALAVWQHFGLGLRQATGSFTGQNTLGMVMNLVVMVPIARILAGPTSLLTKLAPVAAVIAAFFTVSRGTLLFLGIGSALLFVGSVLRKFTPRKAWFGLFGLVVAVAIVPVALTTIESRRASERAESMEMRGLLEDAASAMLQEHPLGVGANHYPAELLLGGYGQRAGLWWRMRTAIVHSVYWLTAAELGYAGVVALLVLFVAPLRMAFSYGLRRSQGRRGDVLLGLGVGLTTLYAHSFFEWAWRLTEVSYVYFMTVALIPVLARQRQPSSALARAGGLRLAGARAIRGEARGTCSPAPETV